jgi:transcriptional regulator with XRE-family HTH domain
MNHSFSAELVRARKSRQLTQLELAVQSGVSLATIQNLEANRGNPEWKTVLALIDALQLKLDLRCGPIDWSRLIALGVPLMSYSVESSSHPFSAKRSTLLVELSVVSENLMHIEMGSRESVGLLAWLCGMRDHYPSVWQKVPVGIKKYLSKSKIPVSLKLRRIAISNLSRYL